jgi:hypothetical protein
MDSMAMLNNQRVNKNSKFLDGQIRSSTILVGASTYIERFCYR